MPQKTQKEKVNWIVDYSGLPRENDGSGEPIGTGELVWINQVLYKVTQSTGEAVILRRMAETTERPGPPPHLKETAQNG